MRCLFFKFHLVFLEVLQPCHVLFRHCPSLAGVFKTRLAWPKIRKAFLSCTPQPEREREVAAQELVLGPVLVVAQVAAVVELLLFVVFSVVVVPVQVKLLWLLCKLFSGACIVLLQILVVL